MAIRSSTLSQGRHIARKKEQVSYLQYYAMYRCWRTGELREEMGQNYEFNENYYQMQTKIILMQIQPKQRNKHRGFESLSDKRAW